MIDLPARHPVFGEGTVVSLDPVSGIAHVRFDSPMGMSANHGPVVPIVEMRLLNGELVPVYAAVQTQTGV